MHEDKDKELVPPETGTKTPEGLTIEWGPEGVNQLLTMLKERNLAPIILIAINQECISVMSPLKSRGVLLRLLALAEQSLLTPDVSTRLEELRESIKINVKLLVKEAEERPSPDNGSRGNTDGPKRSVEYGQYL